MCCMWIFGHEKSRFPDNLLLSGYSLKRKMCYEKIKTIYIQILNPQCNFVNTEGFAGRWRVPEHPPHVKKYKKRSLRIPSARLYYKGLMQKWQPQKNFLVVLGGVGYTATLTKTARKYINPSPAQILPQKGKGSANRRRHCGQ